MGYRKLRGVPLPYEKQGQIYFTCLNFSTAPVYIQRKIERLCESAGGEYASALMELVTTEKTVPQLAQKYYCSPETLARCRKEFYLSW